MSSPAVSTGLTGTGLTGGPSNGIAANLIQGFTYLISNAAFPGGIQAAVKLLDTYGNTKVVSNPHISALDNQKATIKVGTQIPINQQSIVGSTTNVVTTTSSYPWRVDFVTRPESASSGRAYRYTPVKHTTPRQAPSKPPFGSFQ